ncbi:MAG TPA: hypothetical protein VFX18_05855 [Candidatus Nitrosocosmicus sp.]|nr:hypothetical protein [Candidatus Nitrosocosmicus sp.]
MFGDKDGILEIILEKKHVASSPIQIFAEAIKKIDFCFDSILLSRLREDDSFWNTISKLKSRGVSFRFVTEIDSDSLQFCNKIINKANGKVFHTNDIKGNFAIVDESKYLCILLKEPITNESNRISMDSQLVVDNTVNQFIYIKTKSFVDLQQYLFDNLCINSISAEEKIREIKRGNTENFNEVIVDPDEILNTTLNTIYSATQEILLLIPTENSFHRLEYSGILNSIWNASLERNVTVKILISVDHKTNNENIEKNDIIKEKVQKNIRKDHLPIEVQYLPKPLENKLITVIMDQAISLAIEVSDDSQKAFEKSIRSAVYSNSDITVSSCLSIFDTLWIQSELDKQNKIKQAYFQMFKGFSLKDEVYTRKWSFNQNKK